MNIPAKFDLGQDVYAIRNQHKRVWIICSFCGGVGRVDGKDGTDAHCTKCGGHKGKYEYQPTRWMLADDGPEDNAQVLGGMLTIGCINAQVTEHPEDHENVGCADGITYMTRQTGVGAGTLWREQNMFLTRDEALAECDRRNAETAVLPVVEWPDVAGDDARPAAPTVEACCEGSEA